MTILDYSLLTNSDGSEKGVNLFPGKSSLQAGICKAVGAIPDVRELINSLHGLRTTE